MSPTGPRVAEERSGHGRMTTLDRLFALDRHRTTVKVELLGGVTTFVTMAYIIVVNPKILEAAGMPFGAAMAATILTAAFGTLAMGRLCGLW